MHDCPYLSSIVRQCKLLFPPRKTVEIQTFCYHGYITAYFSPLFKLASRFPQKPRPSGIVTFRVTTTSSQLVVYFANETKDCDTPPIENRRFLELLAAASVISDTCLRVFTNKEVHRLEVNAQGDTPYHCL